KPTPLVVLLHGLGSNPQQVIHYEGIVQQAEQRGYIVVAPFGYNTGGWYGSRGQGKNMNVPGARGTAAADIPDNLGELSEQDVLNVLDIARKEFNVDRKRTYLMGHSMGGGGSYYLGMKYPDNWAALAPMAPAIWADAGELSKIQKMPIIVVQGDKDTLVNVEVTRQWVAKMKELKMTHEYIEIADGNHFNTITRNPEMIGKVFEFLAKQKKK
ncbi:MAG TPA: alpha/beta hydrolase, partial [Steroidobacteraceae bacterium]|nr:alpha/beta hydrolase [Steroidobacteraceae bacterium]